jgi:P27 family predicted phage terminase small subunit
MGERGRPKTPLELQQLRAKGDGRLPGGRKPDQVSTELVPVPRTGAGDLDKRSLPKMPARLKAHGRAEWFKIWEEGKIWLRPRSDYRQVEMICQMYDEIDAFQDEIDKTGMMIENYAHVMVANPLYREIMDRRRMIDSLLSKLAFEPHARAKLAIGETKARSGLMDLQSKSREHQAKT